jgi:hypothetical protein
MVMFDNVARISLLAGDPAKKKARQDYLPIGLSENESPPPPPLIPQSYGPDSAA